MDSQSNFLIGINCTAYRNTTLSLSNKDEHREADDGETSYLANQVSKNDGNNNSTLANCSGRAEFDSGCEAEPSLIKNLTLNNFVNDSSRLNNSPRVSGTSGDIDDALMSLRKLALDSDWSAIDNKPAGLFHEFGSFTSGNPSKGNQPQAVFQGSASKRAITGTQSQVGNVTPWQSNDRAFTDVSQSSMGTAWPTQVIAASFSPNFTTASGKRDSLSYIMQPHCSMGQAPVDPNTIAVNATPTSESSAFESAVGRSLASVILNGDNNLTDTNPQQSITKQCERTPYLTASRSISMPTGASSARQSTQLGMAELMEMIRCVPNANLRNALTQLLAMEAQQPASQYAGTIRALLSANHLDSLLDDTVASGSSAFANAVSSSSSATKLDPDSLLFESFMDPAKMEQARSTTLSSHLNPSRSFGYANNAHWPLGQPSQRGMMPTNGRKPSPSCSGAIGLDSFNESSEAKRFSRKVFVGGLPPDVDEAEITEAFRRFGGLVVDWPHKVETKSRFPPKGYCFLIFQDESSVRALIKACIIDDSKLYWLVSSSTVREKPVQIRPWCIADSDFVLDDSQPLDPRKTIFVGGVPRPLRASELALTMNRLYGSVCYAGIDTDPELKYPKGAGRVAFANQQSYVAAISARFVQLHLPEIDKRVEVKPYVLDDQYCDECGGTRCGGKFAPFFCANVTCLQYYCEQCWTLIHAKPGREYHKPLIKDGADRPRAPFRW